MKKRLFVVSVDALFYEDLKILEKCENFSKILNKGSLVQGMLSTYPSMTYVAHTTMMTGCYPTKHGIYHNEKVAVEEKFPPWHWYRKEIKVETIFDKFKAAGYKSSVVNWPVTGGDKSIDYLIPEIWSDLPTGNSRSRFVKVCSPEIIALYDKYSEILDWKNQPELDIFGVNCLKEVVEKYEPEVIFLHLSMVDHARHKHGTFSKEAEYAIGECDKRFGEIVDILVKKSLYDSTNFIICGDHGHLPVKKVFNPNVLFVESNLIKLNDNGSVKSWKAYCHSAGLSSHVTLSPDCTEDEKKKVLKLLENFTNEKKYGCEKIFTSQEVENIYKLTGPFDYVIEGYDDTAFGNNCTGKIITGIDDNDYKLSISGHGYRPEKGPQPIFFGKGPNIKEEVVLPHDNIINQAPTYAKILNVELSNADGHALDEIIKQ